MKVGKEKKEKYERQYWLWVTRPKYSRQKWDDREEFDPLTGVEDLWRSGPAARTQRAIWPYCGGAKTNLNQYLAELGVKKNMSPGSEKTYLFQAESDA